MTERLADCFACPSGRFFRPAPRGSSSGRVCGSPRRRACAPIPGGASAAAPAAAPACQLPPARLRQLPPPRPRTNSRRRVCGSSRRRACLPTPTGASAATPAAAPTRQLPPALLRQPSPPPVRQRPPPTGIVPDSRRPMTRSKLRGRRPIYDPKRSWGPPWLAAGGEGAQDPSEAAAALSPSPLLRQKLRWPRRSRPSSHAQAKRRPPRLQRQPSGRPAAEPGVRRRCWRSSPRPPQGRASAAPSLPGRSPGEIRSLQPGAMAS